MHIKFNGLGKSFGSNILFKGLSQEVKTGTVLVITGKNGSGKSTLLQILMGAVMPTEGKIEFTGIDKIPIPEEYHYGYIALASPWMEWIEEFTLNEMVAFYKKFRFLEGEAILIEKFGLTASGDKYISKFSSGMKQRLKLALAFADTAPCLFLDEPCANLDAEGIKLYKQLIETRFSNKLVVIASNDPEEYAFLPHQMIDVSANFSV